MGPIAALISINTTKARPANPRLSRAKPANPNVGYRRGHPRRAPHEVQVISYKEQPPQRLVPYAPTQLPLHASPRPSAKCINNNPSRTTGTQHAYGIDAQQGPPNWSPTNKLKRTETQQLITATAARKPGTCV